MKRIKIATIAALLTMSVIVASGGFVLWLVSPHHDSERGVDMSAMQPAPRAAPQASAQPPDQDTASTPSTTQTQSATQASTSPANAVSPASESARADRTDGVQLVDLLHRAYCSAYDSESGRLIVIAYKESLGDVYDTSAGARLIASPPAPAKPNAVAAKRLSGKTLFVVAGENDTRLDVLDGETGALAKRIITSGPNIEGVAGNPRDDNPFVYLGTKESKGIGRVNVQTLTEEKPLASSGEAVQVSGDGQSLYFRGQNYLNYVPDGVIKANEDGVPPIPQSYRNGITAFHADPYGASVAVDRTIVSADLQSELGAMEFPIAAFIPETPWVAGVQSNEVCIGSLNDFRTVAKVPLGDDFFQSRDQVDDPRPVQRRRLGSAVKPGDPSPLDYQIFSDAKRQRLLVVSGNQLAIIPLAAFNLPKESSLALAITGPRSGEVYKPIELTVRKIDPSVEVKSLTLPPGMIFDGDRLKWTPGGDQLGSYAIKLVARKDRLQRQYNIAIQVGRPGVDLPFTPRRVALSSDGAKAVVWGHDKIDPSASSAGRYFPNNQLAIVDVAKRKILAKRNMPREIQSAAIDDNGVYIVLNNSEPGFPVEVHKLKLDDLSVTKTASAEKSTDPVEQTLTVVDGKILAFGEEKFKLPELERLPDPTATTDQQLQYLRQPRGGTRDFGDTVWSSGILWSRDLTKAQLIVNPPCFFPPEIKDQYVQWNQPQTKWGRHAWPGTLEGPNGENLLQSSQTGYGPTMLWQIPAACFLAVSDPSTPRLVVRELLKGEETQSIALGGAPRNDESMERVNVLVSAGHVIAACVAGQLHFISLDEIDQKKLAPPFRVALKQAMVMENEKNTSLKYELVDGHPPYQLKLTIGDAHFSEENQQDGTITIDTSKFMDQIERQVRGRAMNLVQPGNKPAERVFDYIEYVTPLFEKVTGRKPTGVPIVIPVKFEATDKDLNVARLSHSYFMELSRAKVVKELDAEVAANQRPRLATTPPRARAEKKTEKEKPSDSVRKEDRKRLLRELAADYSSVLLKRYPPDKVLDEDVDAAAEVAVASLDKAFSEALDKRKQSLKGDVRNWSDQKGHSTSARLQDVFADQVVLLLAKGGQVTVPIEKLSKPDQAFIKQVQDSNTTSRPDEYVPAQMELMLRGIGIHRGQTQRYPPAFVEGQDGQRRLSWRVLILPYIGGQELFKMFRLDQPWNSEHNLKLLKHRPTMFAALDEKVPATHTTIMAVRGKNALIADDMPVSPNDVTDPLDSIIVLTEVKPEKAVEWTRPDDLDDAALDQLRDWIQSHDGKTFVGLSDGSVRVIPSNTPTEELRKAVNVSDGAPNDLKFADSLSAAPGAPAHVATTTQRADRVARRADKKDRSLEELPLGKFVLATEQPNQSLIGEVQTRPDGLTVRTVPFLDGDHHSGQRCVVSPDGIIFGLAGSSLVRFDPGKNRIEKQVAIPRNVRTVYWLGGKLALTCDLGDYHEYKTATGGWRKVDKEPPDVSAPTHYTHGMEVWIVSPTTLKTIRGFVVPGNYLSCAANSDRAFAAHGATSIDRIDLVDLEKGEQLARIPTVDLVQDRDNPPKEAKPDYNDVALLADGGIGVGMGESVLSRIDYANDRLTVEEFTPKLRFDVERRWSLPRVYVSPDGQFMGVLHGGHIQGTPHAPGFLIYKTPDFEHFVGAVNVSENHENLLGLDLDRKIVYVGNDKGDLRVLLGEKTQTYAGLPPDCRQIFPVPKQNAVLLVGTKQSLLVSIPGKAEKWAFEPLPKSVNFEESSLHGSVPEKPLSFVTNPDRAGAPVLADTNYSLGACSADGETFYLFDQRDKGTLSAFDTKSWQEIRRLSDPNIGLYTFFMTAAGPLVHDTSNLKFHLLDPKTLDGLRSFKLPEIKSFVTSPGSNALVGITETGDLRMIDLHTGKLISEIPQDQIRAWDADDLQSSSKSPTVANLAMSLDGGTLTCWVARVHFLKVKDTGLEHYCRSGSFGTLSSAAMLSPHGKHVVYVTPDGKSKVFELPNLGNALSSVFVDPMAIDDRGWQYGSHGEQGSLAVFKPDGHRLYTDPFDGRPQAKVDKIVLDPSHAGRMFAHVYEQWQVVDVKE